MAWSKEEKMAWLEKHHTRELIQMMNGARKTGGFYRPFEWSQDEYSVDDVKEVLATREHIPNKKEAKVLRRAAAKKGR